MKKHNKLSITRFLSAIFVFLPMLYLVSIPQSIPVLADEANEVDITQSSAEEHVLNEENNWDISDQLIMPGESFYTEPKYEFSSEKMQTGVLHFTACPRYLHAALTLDKPDGDADGKAYWYTDALIRSTADTSLVVPCRTTSYNLIKLAYDNGDLSSLQGDETVQDNLQAALKGNHEVPAGYRNNTGLPIVLEQVRGGSTIEEGTVYGGEYGEDLLVYASSLQNWGCAIRFYEPYYLLSYTFDGIDSEFSTEEMNNLPDRYYIQRKQQQLILPDPVRPGHHFSEWSGTLVGFSDVSRKDNNTILTFDWEHNLCTAGFTLFSDQTLQACFEEDFTVTFHPNGGQLKETDPTIREIDTTDSGNDLFFDINQCVPVRSGYQFAGWCTSPAADDGSLIKNTKDSQWIIDWLNDLHENQYDIQLYAKWVKENPCANGHTIQQNITQATTQQDGFLLTKCSVCGKTLQNESIPHIADVRLAAVSYTYSGKRIEPAVIVLDSSQNQLRSTDYTVSYAKGQKKVGNYTVTITFQGNYSGTVQKTFTISPKATNITRLTSAKKKITVSWKKQTAQTSGYQIQYATSAKFKNAKKVTISKNKISRKSIKKLKSKKKYYVRIRTYKTVKANGKAQKIYSSWSKTRTVKTK